MAISTAKDFLAILDRSKLLTDEGFEKARHLVADCADANSAAKILARNKLISWWQAGKLLAGHGTFFLGKYKLIQLLGRGGMGSVLLAEHVMMHRRVALKILPRHVDQNPAMVKRFLAEARTVASLDHPNIVQAYSVDNEADRHYMVMEYVEGLDLQQLVEMEGPLDCASAVDYTRQAAEGLAHAHSRKMIHCDIKPSNLIVNPLGVVKILDMGLARLVGPKDENDPGQDDHVLGSVDYLAPEQALESPEMNHRADIYSLGCTLYYLLTGTPPFPEGTLAQRILKHQTQEPREISDVREDVPANLIAICKKMMAKEPADRFQTAEELSEVLAAWRPSAPVVKRALPVIKPTTMEELPSPEFISKDLGEDFWRITAALPTLEEKKKPGVFWSKPLQTLGSFLNPFVSSNSRMVFSLMFVLILVLLLAFATVSQIRKTPPGGTPTNNASVVVQTPNNETPPSPETNNGSPETPTDIAPPGPPTVQSSANNTSIPAPIAPNNIAPNNIAPNNIAPNNIAPNNIAPTQTTPPDQNQNESASTKNGSQPTSTHPLPIPEPFKDLRKAVALPPLPNEKDPLAWRMISLGAIFIPNSDALQFNLIGSDDVLSQGGTFSIKSNTEQTTFPRWDLFYQSDPNANTSQSLKIATLFLQEENLFFRWINGPLPRDADMLRFCRLQFAANNKSEMVSLSRPRWAKPLALNWDDGTAEQQIKSDLLPDHSRLRFHIIDMAESLPAHRFEPSDAIKIGDSLRVVFTDSIYSHLALEIQTSVSETGISLHSILETDIAGKGMRPFKIKEMERYVKDTKKALESKQARFNGMSEKNLGKANLGKTIAEETQSLQTKEGLFELAKKMTEEKAKINFNIYLQLDKSNVELYNSTLFHESLPDPNENKPKVRTTHGPR